MLTKLLVPVIVASLLSPELAIDQRSAPQKEGTQDQTPRSEPPKVDDRRNQGGAGTGAMVATGAASLAAGLLLGRLFSGSGKTDPVNLLDEKGPQLPPAYLMSSFTVRGFVRGNWPIVVEYTAPAGTLLLLTIASDAGVEFNYRLPALGGRQQLMTDIPAEFGAEPNPATYTIRAMVDNPNGGPTGSVPLRIHGLGAGHRAVGSVGIDQVKFSPSNIRRKEAAQYVFRAHHAFPKVIAEFMAVNGQKGFVDVLLQESTEHKDRVSTNRENRGNWSPRKKETRGNHFVQIRGWFSIKEVNNQKQGGDWVLAWSDDLVNVSE